MKRALSVATVTALTLLALLFVGYAQEAGKVAVPQLLEQELASMEAAFGSVQNVMTELITEVKGSMSDIVAFNAKVKDLKDIVSAVSLEIKAAEGKILGLREDVDALGSRQQELKVRVVALEAGLSELSAFCDGLKARLDVQGMDLSDLKKAVEAQAAAFDAHVQEFVAFKEQILADLEALRTGLYADFGTLRSDLYGSFDALKTDVYGNLDALKTDVFGNIDAVRNGIYSDLMKLEETFTADVTLLESRYAELATRVQALEDEDVGTFKRKVLELERSMAALAIKIDNNRAKLEGFDQAIAGLSQEMASTKDGILKANEELLGEYESRLQALEEDDVKVKGQIDTLFFISIVGLLAGVGSLIWGFLGTN